MNNKIDLKEKKVWSSLYKDTLIEIVNWKSKKLLLDIDNLVDADCWNYYVYLYESRLENFDALWLEPTNQYSWGAGYDYYSLPIYNIFWHGGITYYEKLNNDAIGKRMIKVGCDYSHLFDLDQTYELPDIVSDAIQTVDELHGVLQFKTSNEKE